ncbi:cupin domain-containing protein [Nocardia puris]|uniref:Cupin domain n=1 Tax=Nocardia puris TaxID=208602 RepID=A0A366CV02_9NOCA|nr:cupin domain-containing protein [Nocardia puris]MBF6216028.1 cupin domain-containing protein [Nocardia puris]MBF6370222.1 cupin domain-containing protein [Nocardia puris]MBF6463551.1 cupin domain-containing protein [Nocardia puris]RBO80116.1 cupin domain [Nocardia puris]
MTSSALTFRNGHRVTLVDQSADDRGPYLRLSHVLPEPGRQAGPHWHPVITESWTVRQGRLRFRIEGEETVANPGDTVTAPPRAVHEFWNESPDTVMDHEIRPPAQHWEMFRLWQRLDVDGRTTRGRVPRNPLALALLWELQDGYIAGVPAAVQRIVFGGLAATARRVGYERRIRSTM